MKIIVTHASPDWDAITSVWLIKRFLTGWEDAGVQFVPAGERLNSEKFKVQNEKLNDPIEKIGDNEVIHVDTGLGPLDHHQTESQEESAASRTWDYVRVQSEKFNPSIKLRTGVKSEESERVKDQEQAIDRIVRVIVDIDHFKEVFWEDPTADYHDFSLLALLNGLKLQKPGEDLLYIDSGMQCLDAILHSFENRIWAEKEIKERGKEFKTRFGKGIGFETINDDVLQLAQKMGYVVVVRKDPRKGYVRIKARPASPHKKLKIKNQKGSGYADLTLAYEKLKKMDPDATWFLHVSKKMLLNGTVKNPKMIPTKLTLDEIIRVLESV